MNADKPVRLCSAVFASIKEGDETVGFRLLNSFIPTDISEDVLINQQSSLLPVYDQNSQTLSMPAINTNILNTSKDNSFYTSKRLIKTKENNDLFSILTRLTTAKVTTRTSNCEKLQQACQNTSGICPNLNINTMVLDAVEVLTYGYYHIELEPFPPFLTHITYATSPQQFYYLTNQTNNNPQAIVNTALTRVEVNQFRSGSTHYIFNDSQPWQLELTMADGLLEPDPNQNAFCFEL